MYSSYRRRRIVKKESWRKHCTFGIVVSIRLLITSIIFVLNGIFPFIPIPSAFTLKNTSYWTGRLNFNRQQDHQRYIKV